MAITMFGDFAAPARVSAADRVTCVIAEMELSALNYGLNK